MAVTVGKFLICIEICFIAYWFISQTYIIFTFDTVSSDRYRIAGLFIGIHSLVSPAAILFVLNSSDKHSWSLLWIFLFTLLYDMIELFDIVHHLDRGVISIAWNLQCTAVIWTFTMSLLEAVWYMAIVFGGNNSEKRILK